MAASLLATASPAERRAAIEARLSELRLSPMRRASKARWMAEVDRLLALWAYADTPGGPEL